MNGFGELLEGIKEVSKELERLNTKMDKLDTFDKHVVELTAVSKELVKVLKGKNL